MVPSGRGHLEDPGMDGKITLRWIIRKGMGEAWPPLIWLRIEIGGGVL
jgi:hypothetical protein